MNQIQEKITEYYENNRKLSQEQKKFNETVISKANPSKLVPHYIFEGIQFDMSTKFEETTMKKSQKELLKIKTPTEIHVLTSKR